MTSTKTLTPALYYQIRDDLWNNYPNARAAIQEAANNLLNPPPTPATLINAIGLFVEKPLYSAMHASKGGLGDRYSYMWRHSLFPTPAVLASPAWQIDQVGIHKFVAVGASVQAFQTRTPKPLGAQFPGKNEPKVALARLYRMRNIAIAYPKALAVLAQTRAGFQSSNSAADFEAHMKPALAKLGTPGAMTTTFHAMADAGFDCIKPDMHAARAFGWFNQLSTKTARIPTAQLNADAVKNPNAYLRDPWNKCHVVACGVGLARTLAKAPNRLLSIFNGNACREADIVMMQASLHDVILKHP
jgi:hypothetical protein